MTGASLPLAGGAGWPRNPISGGRGRGASQPVASAPQLDLFSAAAANAAAASSRFARPGMPSPDPAPLEQLAAVAKAGANRTEDAGRKWAEARIVVWSKRAASLRAAIAAGSGGPGAEMQAFALEWHVKRLRDRWGLGNGVAAAVAGGGPIAGELATLRRRLEAWQPRFDDKLGVQVNDGPISAELRAQIEARIRELGGDVDGQ